MPLEYTRIGSSIESASSAKAMMSSALAATSSRRMPSSTPLSKILSRPVSSGWNPAPSSSSGATRPWTRTVPDVGRSTPAISARIVLLPTPLRPMMPTDSPVATAKVTSCSTSRSTCRMRRSASPGRSTRPLMPPAMCQAIE